MAISSMPKARGAAPRRRQNAWCRKDCQQRFQTGQLLRFCASHFRRGLRTFFRRKFPQRQAKGICGEKMLRKRWPGPGAQKWSHFETRSTKNGRPVEALSLHGAAPSAPDPANEEIKIDTPVAVGKIEVFFRYRAKNRKKKSGLA
jgi:hypothetical protein